MVVNGLRLGLMGLVLVMGAACSDATPPTPESTSAPSPEPVAPANVPTPLPEPTPVPTPAPAATASTSTGNTNTNPANCVNRAGNVRDVTVPDDTVFKPGEFFTKTWRIRNLGTCTWGPGYTLAFAAGDEMKSILGTQISPIPAVQPNQDVQVSISLQASFNAGKFKGYWLLRDPQGRNFGTGNDANIPFWVQIVVRR
jgi:hypothetical protein